VDWLLEDIRPRYLETMEESMVDTATILASVLSNQIEGDVSTVKNFRTAIKDLENFRTAFGKARDRTFSARIYRLTKTNLTMRVYVTDKTGIVIFDSDEGRDEGKDYSRWNDVHRTLRGEYGARTSHPDPAAPGKSILYVAAPIIDKDEIAGVLTVCKPSDSLVVFIYAAKKKIIQYSIAAALSVVLLGLVFSFWITRPINRLTEYAKAVRDGKRQALPELGKNEIGQLGEAFEQMRDALEGKQYVESYIQTLTHEMKSPLSAIRGASELLQEKMQVAERTKFLKNIRTETERIQNMIERLLQLSALENRKGLTDVQDIDVSELAEEAVESLAPLIVAKRINFDKNIGREIYLSGNRFLIKQSLANLLQNAVDFTPEKGTISVLVKRGDAYIELEVSDDGPGVPDYALDRIFDRFYSLQRPGTSKKSSGLGLTFVKEATALHGGTIALENRPDGGVTARLRFPSTSNSS
jgi:two-component system sensor histidine kinase CreC